MTYYDSIYEVAIDNHYLFTTQDAATAGIPVIELAKLAHRGRLEKLGNGVYRLARNIPAESDPYAVAVARAGEGAFLYGESVIALLGLAPTNPERIFVASPRRVRKTLPKNIVLKRISTDSRITHYDAIPCQRVVDAILACRDAIMPERLQEAARRARELGYLTTSEEELLKKEMKW